MDSVFSLHQPLILQDIDVLDVPSAITGSLIVRLLRILLCEVIVGRCEMVWCQMVLELEHSISIRGTYLLCLQQVTTLLALLLLCHALDLELLLRYITCDAVYLSELLALAGHLHMGLALTSQVDQVFFDRESVIPVYQVVHADQRICLLLNLESALSSIEWADSLVGLPLALWHLNLIVLPHLEHHSLVSVQWRVQPLVANYEPLLWVFPDRPPHFAKPVRFLLDALALDVQVELFIHEHVFVRIVQV